MSFRLYPIICDYCGRVIEVIIFAADIDYIKEIEKEAEERKNISFAHKKCFEVYRIRSFILGGRVL